MADNRVAYGLAKKYGIDTTDMSPKEVWDALEEKGVKIPDKSKNLEKKNELVKKYSSEMEKDITSDMGDTKTLNKDITHIRNHYNWAIENGFVSPLISFEDYKNIAIELSKIAIGKIAADGTKIKEIKNHCIDRVCGTTEKENGVKHEGVSLEDFEETLFHGEVREIIETNTIIFISKKCKIAINPKEGAIKQCNKC